MLRGCEAIRHESADCEGSRKGRTEVVGTHGGNNQFVEGTTKENNHQKTEERRNRLR